MELTHDWRCFQSVFYPKRRAPLSQGHESASPVYLVVENNVVISAYGEGADYSEWIGANHQDLAAEITHRELVLFDRKDVDRLTQESLTLPHFYDQVEFLRGKATPQIVSRSRFKRGMEMPVHRHFLLEALQSWWGKVLPSAFGLMIRLQGTDNEPNQDLFMVVRRGRVDLFCEPELSTIGLERARNPASVVKYLSEKHLVPVQGIFVPAAQWAEWSESENPWGQVAHAIRSNQAKLVPFRWGIVTLVATRGFLTI